MTKISVPSGADVEIHPSGWKAAKTLKAAIERAVALTGDFSIRTALLVDSSAEVDAALQLCLARCLYNGQKIIELTFDPVETRGDYYDIVEACVKENLGPLAASLRSKLSEYGLLKTQAPIASAQKPVSTTNADSSPPV